MPISKEAEDRICRGLTQVAALVRDGNSPNQAIIKVAQDEKIPAGHVKLMAAAFNTGRTNRQRTSAADLFDKVAEFELADPAVILEAIYPKNVKTAAAIATATIVSDDYAAPPDWMRLKLARERAALPLDYPEPTSPPPPMDPDRFQRRIAGGLHQLQLEREKYARSLQEGFDRCSSLYGELCDYFRSATALPFEDVAANAEALYGKAAAAIFGKLAADPSCVASAKMRIDRRKKPKPAVPPVVVKRAYVADHAVDRAAPPYTYVEKFIKAAEDYKQLLQQAGTFEKAAVTAEFRLARAAHPAPPQTAQAGVSLMRRLAGEKLAFLGASALGTMAQGVQLGAGADVGRSIFQKLLPKTDEKLKSDALAGITDPSHEAKLRAIRAQSALHNILTGPYFEGEDPTKVTELFNNLTRMAPRMAEQPLLLEAAMRRVAAQGSADPHDLDQFLGLETKLKQRDRMPREESNSEA